MKKYLYTSALFLAALLFSACDTSCPCDREDVYEYSCSPKEVTITEFNPALEDDPIVFPADSEVVAASQVTYIPVDSYSIHSFEFPFNTKTSGSLPNNEAFDSDYGISKMPLASYSVKEYDIDLPYFFAVLSDVPHNSEIEGDILVTDIFSDNADAANSSATIMITGNMIKIDNDFTSESSKDFCEWIESEFSEDGSIDKDKVIEYRNRADESKYGRDISGFARESNYTDLPIYVINSKGQIVVDFSSGVPQINEYAFVGNPEGYNKLLSNLNRLSNAVSEARGDLFEKLEENDIDFYVTVRVSIGDVFFYRASNGRDFIFAVINISERPDPFEKVKKRISIIFNNI